MTKSKNFFRRGIYDYVHILSRVHQVKRDITSNDVKIVSFCAQETPRKQSTTKQGDILDDSSRHAA